MALITRERLAELRRVYGLKVHPTNETACEMLDTLDKLWKVAEAAREYHCHRKFHSECSLCVSLTALEGGE